MVNQISDKEICPEEHRDEGPLLNPIGGTGSWVSSRLSDQASGIGLLEGLLPSLPVIRPQWRQAP